MNDGFNLQDLTEKRFVPLPTIQNLPEGAVLLAFRPREEPFLLKILCYLAGKVCPFVVWTYNRTTGGCSHGHYHKDIVEAEKAFLAGQEFLDYD